MAEDTKQCENTRTPCYNDDDDDDNDTYHIKWIDWFEEKIPIITQNKNGPCPLLAIFNVLLLSKRVSNCTNAINIKFMFIFFTCL